MLKRSNKVHPANLEPEIGQCQPAWSAKGNQDGSQEERLSEEKFGKGPSLKSLDIEASEGILVPEFSPHRHSYVLFVAEQQRSILLNPVTATEGDVCFVDMRSASNPIELHSHSMQKIKVTVRDQDRQISSYSLNVVNVVNDVWETWKHDGMKIPVAASTSPTTQLNIDSAVPLEELGDVYIAQNKFTTSFQSEMDLDCNEKLVVVAKASNGWWAGLSLERSEDHVTPLWFPAVFVKPFHEGHLDLNAPMQIEYKNSPLTTSTLRRISLSNDQAEFVSAAQSSDKGPKKAVTNFIQKLDTMTEDDLESLEEYLDSSLTHERRQELSCTQDKTQHGHTRHRRANLPLGVVFVMSLTIVFLIVSLSYGIASLKENPFMGANWNGLVTAGALWPDHLHGSKFHAHRLILAPVIPVGVLRMGWDFVILGSLGVRTEKLHGTKFFLFMFFFGGFGGVSLEGVLVPDWLTCGGGPGIMAITTSLMIDIYLAGLDRATTVLDTTMCLAVVLISLAMSMLPGCGVWSHLGGILFGAFAKLMTVAWARNTSKLYWFMAILSTILCVGLVSCAVIALRRTSTSDKWCASCQDACLHLACWCDAHKRLGYSKD
eukprot:m.77838 g.77838  ORF g.77838 m.77838 type:complete len:602 (+) comp12644_c0_seq2:105-1910(+)